MYATDVLFLFFSIQFAGRVTTIATWLNLPKIQREKNQRIIRCWLTKMQLK